MKLKLGLAAALMIIAPLSFAGDPNAKISDVIAQIEARRNDKTAAEAKSAQDRATEDNGGNTNWGGGGMGRKHGGGGGDKKGN